jgi:phosphotransferase system  glucose/maltose/N-acetylglucosamine-specific IIC component
MDWRNLIKNKWLYIAVAFLAATVGMFVGIISAELWMGFVGSLIAGNFIANKVTAKKKTNEETLE